MIGAMMRIDQKSGCSARRKNTRITIKKNGINPSKRSQRRNFRFFMKYARNITSPIFINSTGWREKGTHGISIHHFAPLYSAHTKRTINKKLKVIKNISFANFSRYVYGIFVMIAIILIPIQTWMILRMR